MQNEGTLIRELCKLSSLAHHPDCKCFDNHLIRIGRLALCLGCTSLSIGLCLGSTIINLAAAFHPIAIVRVGCLGHVLAGLICFAPTLVQPHWQKKWFKIVARCMLGVAIVFLWFGPLVLLPETLNGVALRGVFVVVFFAVAAATLAIRKRKSQDLWKCCESGGFPFCNENLRRKQFLFAGAKSRVVDADAVLAGILATVAQDGGDTADIEFSTADKLLRRGVDG